MDSILTLQLLQIVPAVLQTPNESLHISHFWTKSAILVCALFLLDFHWSTAISTRPVVCATDIEGMLFLATPSAVHLSAPGCTLIIKECWIEREDAMNKIKISIDNNKDDCDSDNGMLERRIELSYRNQNGMVARWWWWRRTATMKTRREWMLVISKQPDHHLSL